MINIRIYHHEYICIIITTDLREYYAFSLFTAVNLFYIWLYVLHSYQREQYILPWFMAMSTTFLQQLVMHISP